MTVMSNFTPTHAPTAENGTDDGVRVLWNGLERELSRSDKIALVTIFCFLMSCVILNACCKETGRVQFARRRWTR